MLEPRRRLKEYGPHRSGREQDHRHPLHEVLMDLQRLGSRRALSPRTCTPPAAVLGNHKHSRRAVIVEAGERRSQAVSAIATAITRAVRRCDGCPAALSRCQFGMGHELMPPVWVQFKHPTDSRLRVGSHLVGCGARRPDPLFVEGPRGRFACPVPVNGSPNFFKLQPEQVVASRGDHEVQRQVHVRLVEHIF